MKLPNEAGIFAELDAKEADKEREKQAQKALDNAIKSTLASKQGRATLAWCLTYAGLDASVSAADPIVMSNLSGRRDVGLAILARLRGLNPEAVDLMFKEFRDG